MSGMQTMKQAVVKAASENRHCHVISGDLSAAVVPGESTVMMAQVGEGLTRVERPDDFVADDVGYRVVEEQGGLLEVEHETIRE